MKHLHNYKLFLEYNDYIQKEIDSILDKISNNGIDSLTSEEKKFMDAHKGGEEESEEAYKRLTSFDSDERLLTPGEVRTDVNTLVEDWLDYAKSYNIERNVIEFIRNNPNYLIEFPPRVWSIVSSSIKHAKYERDIKKVISVLTNKQIAQEYMDMYYN